MSAKEPLRDPNGGLTAAGRRHFRETEGAHLRPGVRGAADTPTKMRRKGSFLTRFFTNPSGPMVNDKGEPTRLALSARAWGEPVPKNMDDAAKLAAKGRRLLERYANQKEKQDSKAADGKKKNATREEALAVAKMMGCDTVHEVDGGWMPCSSSEEMERISKLAEDDSWLNEPISEKDTVSSSGRKRKRRVRRWENLAERSYGMTGVPGVGIVSSPPAQPTSPMGDSYASGPSGVITLSAEGKGLQPFTPEVGEPDVFTSPDAARIRSRQIGCTGIRRYTTSSGVNVWMPCTTGVTFDRTMGYGAYSRSGSRLEAARIEREVRRQLRAGGHPNKKSAKRLAATPAKPSERIRGSSSNAEGSASSVRKASGISLSPEQEKALVVKSREHNAAMKKAKKSKWSYTSPSALKAVMRRGMGAFSSSHRPDVSSRQQWGMGRVNAFLVILEKGAPKNRKYTTDNDLLRAGHPWKERTIGHNSKIEPIGDSIGGSIGRSSSGGNYDRTARDGDGDGSVQEGTDFARSATTSPPRPVQDGTIMPKKNSRTNAGKLVPSPSVPGNINLSNRKRVRLPDGSIATILSMSFNDGKNEVVIPTIGPNGEVLTEKQARNLYIRTGQHLGKFPKGKSNNAETYAIWLHEQEERRIAKPAPAPVAPRPGSRNTTNTPINQSTKKDPIDADRDGWIDEGKPTRRFVGIRALRDAVRSGVGRGRDILGRGGSRRQDRSIRVSAGEGVAGRARSRRIVGDMDSAVRQIANGNKPKKPFKPKKISNVPQRISSERLRRLKPQRINHASLVRTQKAYPHAPKIEGDFTPLAADELGRAKNGGLKSTFDHFGIGSGEIPAERRALHESIIKAIIYGNGKWSPKKQENPAAWIMGGGPASGKTFLRQGGFFDTPERGEAVHLDADEIKHMIPEFDSLVKELTDAGIDPTQAASAVHAESTYIQRQAIARAAAEGFHVVVDSTGDGGPKSFHAKIDTLREKGYKIKGRFADVSIGKALTDAKARQKEEKRGIPDDILVDTHIDVARAVLYSLQEGLFDDFELVNNENHDSPVTVAAFKDGVLAVHDTKKWSEFIGKARLAFTNDYGQDYFDAVKNGTGKARNKAERVKARKAKTKEVDGVQTTIAEPVRSLAAALPETGIDFAKVKAVPATERAEIANAYNGLPDRSPESKAAYDALQVEIEEHFKMLTEDMGVKVELVDEDPYANAIEMMDDIENNGVLKVLKTEATGSHPYWSDEVNDKFRAVHDAFGHAATGRGFDRHGEEAAYQAHRAMVKNVLAKLALATETRGQNSALIEFGEFPTQKAALLDDALTKQAALPPMPRMFVPPDPPIQTGMIDSAPATADQDNVYESTRCHHVSGGRRLEAQDEVASVDGLYSDLGDDKRLSPETRQKIYVVAASGAESLDDSGLDNENDRIASYFKTVRKGVSSLGKNDIAKISNSAVESLPDSIE